MVINPLMIADVDLYITYYIFAVYDYHCGMDDHEKTCMKLLPQVAALLCTL
jgi:hypothetical protein